MNAIVQCTARPVFAAFAVEEIKKSVSHLQNIADERQAGLRTLQTLFYSEPAPDYPTMLLFIGVM